MKLSPTTEGIKRRARKWKAGQVRKYRRRYEKWLSKDKIAMADYQWLLTELTAGRSYRKHKVISKIRTSAQSKSAEVTAEEE